MSENVFYAQSFIRIVREIWVTVQESRRFGLYPTDSRIYPAELP